MRKWLVIAVAFAMLSLAGAVLWPRSPVGPSPTPPPPAARALPEFAAVAVSSGAAEGLVLTGRVLDPQGRPVADAEVSLAASAEKTLTAVRCDECGLALLACPARESALHAWEFFEQARGFLQARATTRTDAQGRFRFEHLAGVSFSVWAQAGGLGAALRERAAPGEPVDLFLSPPRSISGQVVDEQGRGLAGARVYAVSRKVPVPAEARSGANGTFTLAGLGEGPFYVVASAKDFLPAVEPQVEAGPRPVRLRLEPARSLEVRVTHQGQPVEARVRLHGDHLSREARAEHGGVRFDNLYPDSLVVSAEAGALGAEPRALTLSERLTRVTLELEEAGTLLVTVVDEAGQPVPAPRLQLRAARGASPIQTQKSAPGAAPGALVQFGPLAVGDYSLEGEAPGYQPAQLPVHIKPGETALELELERATLITGQVLDQYGRPAPNVSVLVQPTGEAVLADGEGRFSLPVPTPGLYELHAHHSEWGGGQVKATAPAEGVKLELEPRAALEVTVMAEGRRVEGADVVLWIERDGIFRSDSTSGSDGVVPMRGLPAGTYQLMATHHDYLPSPRQAVTVEDGQTQRVTVTLEPGAVLTGEVVDGQGAPVSGASVSVIPRMTEVVTTDAQGHFEMRALKPGRAYLVEARHPGYTQTDAVQGQPGDKPVRVVMKAREVFRGRVVAENGEPVRHFRLDDHEVTSPDGRFEEPLAVVEERLMVSVEAKGFLPLTVDKPARPNDLGDLVLQRAAMLSGRVREESGAPVADAVVGCDACDDSVMTGPEGAFSLPAPALVTKFNVSARKGRLSASVAVAQGEADRAVELVLKRATRLSGRVYRPDGTPAAGTQVEGINMDRSETLSIVTGPDGRYSVDVAPGNYRFMNGGREFSGQTALLTRVGEGEQTLDFGPAPGTVPLSVRLEPGRGRVLWVVAGDARGQDFARREPTDIRYGQYVFQPDAELVTLRGFPPGRYTLVWAAMHATGEPPVTRLLDLPSSAEVVLTPP